MVSFFLSWDKRIPSKTLRQSRAAWLCLVLAACLAQCVKRRGWELVFISLEERPGTLICFCRSFQKYWCPSSVQQPSSCPAITPRYCWATVAFSWLRRWPKEVEVPQSAFYCLGKYTHTHMRVCTHTCMCAHTHSLLLGIKPRTLNIQSRPSMTELYP